MAKRVTQKPAKSAAKAAAASAAIPAPNGPAQATEQGMTTTLSPGATSNATVNAPAEVSGVFPPQVLPSEVVTNAAGDTFEEGDLQEEDVVVDPALEADEVLSAPALQEEDAVDPELEADEVLSAPADPLAGHPAIVAAQSYQTGHGVPASGHHHYFTPPPPELRKPRAKAN